MGTKKQNFIEKYLDTKQKKIVVDIVSIIWYNNDMQLREVPVSYLMK